jgi:hypothetical protein
LKLGKEFSQVLSRQALGWRMTLSLVLCSNCKRGSELAQTHVEAAQQTEQAYHRDEEQHSSKDGAAVVRARDRVTCRVAQKTQRQAEHNIRQA